MHQYHHILNKPWFLNLQVIKTWNFSLSLPFCSLSIQRDVFTLCCVLHLQRTFLDRNVEQRTVFFYITTKNWCLNWRLRTFDYLLAFFNQLFKYSIMTFEKVRVPRVSFIVNDIIRKMALAKQQMDCFVIF